MTDPVKLEAASKRLLVFLENVPLPPRVEVARDDLRAALKAEPAQGGDDFNPVFDAGFRQGRAFTRAETAVTQDSAQVGDITKRVRAEQAVLTALRAKERAAGRAEMRAEVREAFNQCLSRMMSLEVETAIRHLAAKLPGAE